MIKYLIQLKDESVFNKIESVINSNKPRNNSSFSKQEIIDRAIQSNKDFSEGNFITQDELEKESENW